jgi:hypothetical protein
MHVDNFRVVTVTFSQFSDRVFNKLGIRVAYNQSWYYKMNDYKATLAHLFPEIVNERKYAYWGKHPPRVSYCGVNATPLILCTLKQYLILFAASYLLNTTYLTTRYSVSVSVLAVLADVIIMISGYTDLDLVWGNFSRFAHLFQGDYAVVTSGKVLPFTFGLLDVEFTIRANELLAGWLAGWLAGCC